MSLFHNTTQFVTYTPSMTDPQWLGAHGHVNALKYSWTIPGGPDQMSCNLMVEADTRTRATDPGRIVQGFRGGALIWEGIMNEPVPTTAGWNLSAVGAGNYGTNYVAYYTDTWPTGEPDEAVNDAISRGLRWVNPGIGSPSGIWLGQEVDPGAQTITDLLNLVCTNGALTWSVTTTPQGNFLSVFALPETGSTYPQTPGALLLVRQPAPRTLGGDINVIYIRYQSAADNATTGAAATYGTTTATVPASIALHGEREAYIDLSDAGTLTSSAAQAVGNSILERYQRASFSGPFAAGPGDLMTPGGQAMDLGMNYAGTIVQLVLVDYGYGGEVVLGPVTFMIGSYEYDDDSLSATITPFQYLNTSMSGLLSAASTTIAQPAAVAAPAA